MIPIQIDCDEMSNVKNQNVGTSFEIIYIFNSMPFIAQRLAQRNKKKKRKKKRNWFRHSTRIPNLYQAIVINMYDRQNFTLSLTHIISNLYTAATTTVLLETFTQYCNCT